MVVCNPEGSASQRSLISEITTVEYLKLFELRLIQSRGHGEGTRHVRPRVRVQFLRLVGFCNYWYYIFFKIQISVK